MSKRATPGIDVRHSRRCPSRSGGECDEGKRGGCTPSYQAHVWDRATKTRVRKTFETRAAALAWREDSRNALRKGRSLAQSKRTLREASEEFLAKAEAGEIVSRYRTPYKPSVTRGYRHDLEHHVLPDLGAYKLGDLRRRDFQALADRLIGQGLSGQKVRNVLVPVQAVYRRAVRAEEVATSPVADLDLPAPAKPRERSIAPEEATALLDALPDDGLRALYTCAFLSGLRRGELRGLRWDAVDFDAGTIAVRSSWDDHAGEVGPKSRAGVRRVPMGSELRRVLAAHKLATGRDGRDFVFGSKKDQPFTPSAVRRRAETAWSRLNTAETTRAKQERRVPNLLVPAGLHELRHASSRGCSTAGLSLERIGDYVGHSSTYMTSAYRHLLDGHEAEAAKLQDDYLARRATTARQSVSRTSGFQRS
jgi:integrase